MNETAQQAAEIRDGSIVTMHFCLETLLGMEAINTFQEEPISFTVGDGTFVKTLELAILGLKAGDYHEFKLKPEQAYGPHDPTLVTEIPLGDFPQHLQPEAGQIIGFTTPEGEEAPGLIQTVENDMVRVDFNNPLAGEEIIFTVEIIDVNNSSS